MKKTTLSTPSTPPSVNGSTQATADHSDYVNHESVSRRAYELWQEAGCPDGRETEFWLHAEQQLGDVAAANRAKR